MCEGQLLISVCCVCTNIITIRCTLHLQLILTALLCWQIEQLELEISQIAAFMKSLSNLEKARMVDKVSRVAFPVAFIIFNIVYWLVYLVDF